MSSVEMGEAVISIGSPRTGESIRTNVCEANDPSIDSGTRVGVDASEISFLEKKREEKSVFCDVSVTEGAAEGIVLSFEGLRLRFRG